MFLNNQWIYTQQTVGTFPKLISVPTHFFKVIKGKRYVRPNHDLNSANNKNNSNNKSSINPIDSSLNPEHSVELEQVCIGAFLLPNQDISLEVIPFILILYLYTNTLLYFDFYFLCTKVPIENFLVQINQLEAIGTFQINLIVYVVSS